VALELIVEDAAHVRLFACSPNLSSGTPGSRSAATTEQANALIESDEHIEGRRSLD
jgi:hypothetical protein